MTFDAGQKLLRTKALLNSRATAPTHCLNPTLISLVGLLNRVPGIDPGTGPARHIH